MTNEIVIKNLDDLDRLAKEFSENLNGNEIILLNGELGAGKTTFTKYLLKYMGVDEDVLSPTFTIMNNYRGRFDIYHIDLYRVDNFDISDIAGNGIIIIEWPKGEDYKKFNVPTYNIDISVEDNGFRVFRIDKIN